MKKSPLTIAVAYASGDPCVELRFNASVRAIFAQAAEKARDFYRNEQVRNAAQGVSEQILTEWGAGLDTLDKLGFIPSTPLHLTPWECHMALNLVSIASLVLLGRVPSISPLPGAFILLAGFTPCRLTRRNLPPAAELWTDGAVSKTLHQEYERIRLQSAKGETHIMVCVAHVLRDALAKLQRPGATIDLLRHDLAQVSRTFTCTLQQLAGNKTIQFDEEGIG